MASIKICNQCRKEANWLLMVEEVGYSYNGWTCCKYLTGVVNREGPPPQGCLRSFEHAVASVNIDKQQKLGAVNEKD
jgi:hypothetical protein